ncbi:hypothetical protein CDL15_Pgr015615 [Punica granatum]|uniref:Uncharacterized protein n=2 Tax=Punica granatum TaxID=22663 RepID=A0A218XP30_PUNGR|nr:hypothetical protein CDL15_Pgr015615 [Punica granatum]
MAFCFCRGVKLSSSIPLPSFRLCPLNSRRPVLLHLPPLLQLLRHFPAEIKEVTIWILGFHELFLYADAIAGEKLEPLVGNGVKLLLRIAMAMILS